MLFEIHESSDRRATRTLKRIMRGTVQHDYAARRVTTNATSVYQYSQKPAVRGGRSINERKVMMKKVILLLAFAAMTASTGAQKVAVKNNVVYDVLATPNLGVELGRDGRRPSIYRVITIRSRRTTAKCSSTGWWPEFRYWLCERFNGHFFGVHLLGGEYNISKVKLPFGLARDGKEHRYDGWYVGGGFSYGYQWMLARGKWSIEATVGVGYVRFDYDKYGCRD